MARSVTLRFTTNIVSLIPVEIVSLMNVVYVPSASMIVSAGPTRAAVSCAAEATYQMLGVLGGSAGAGGDAGSAPATTATGEAQIFHASRPLDSPVQ